MIPFRTYAETLQDIIKDPRDALVYLAFALIEEGDEGFKHAVRHVADRFGVVKEATNVAITTTRNKR